MAFSLLGMGGARTEFVYLGSGYMYVHTCTYIHICRSRSCLDEAEPHHTPPRQNRGLVSLRGGTWAARRPVDLIPRYLRQSVTGLWSTAWKLDLNHHWNELRRLIPDSSTPRIKNEDTQEVVFLGNSRSAGGRSERGEYVCSRHGIPIGWAFCPLPVE